MLGLKAILVSLLQAHLCEPDAFLVALVTPRSLCSLQRAAGKSSTCTLPCLVGGPFWPRGPSCYLLQAPTAQMSLEDCVQTFVTSQTDFSYFELRKHPQCILPATTVQLSKHVRF